MSTDSASAFDVLKWMQTVKKTDKVKTFFQAFRQPAVLLSQKQFDEIERSLQRLVDEKKRLQSIFEHSERRFQEIASKLDNILYISNPQTRETLYISPGFEGFFGIAVEDNKLPDLSGFVHKEDRRRFLQFQERWQQGETDIEYRVVKKDGTVKWVRDRIFPIPDARGRIQQVVGIAEDITDRKRFEESLKSKYQVLDSKVEEQQDKLHDLESSLDYEKSERKAIGHKLEESEKYRLFGELVASFAHEAKNPLNAIQSNSDVLMQGFGEDADQKLFIDNIQTQVERLTVLVNDMLELGKPVEHYDFSKASLLSIIHNAIESFEQANENRRILFNPPSQSMPVWADSVRLQQVFVNLLKNAAQHSPGSTPVTLSVSFPEKERLRIEITDRGSGIDPYVLPHIFEPFYTTRKEGTGLGLGIVKRLVRLHGGDVALQNNEQQPGCTAVITLPLLSEESA